MPEAADRASSPQTPARVAPVESGEPAGRRGAPPPPRDDDPALLAERHRKADGRLLILYHWEGEDG